MRARILFIGAPFGSLFRELAGALEQQGATVLRVVVDGGDLMETPSRNRVFIDRGVNWAGFVRRLILARRINTIVTYNDTLPRNRIALAIARRMGIDRLVLENGYLRPHHITLAINGVNGNSELSRDAEIVRQAVRPEESCRTFPVRMRPHVLNTIRHFAWATLLKPVLPYNTSYYGDAVGRQAIGYIREYAWRLMKGEEAEFERVLRHKREGAGRLFLTLMQKPGDSQIRYHSTFGTNATFLETVLCSFADTAPDDALLVVKQHPLDYGIEDLPAVFRQLCEQLGIAHRAVYLRKTGIAKVMDIADAMVTINSTGGLQGVMGGVPVKCLGKAVYDVPGLTFQGPLEDFWTQAERPDPGMVEAYRHFLLATCQINGGFHTSLAREILVPALTRRILTVRSWGAFPAARPAVPSNESPAGEAEAHGLGQLLPTA